MRCQCIPQLHSYAHDSKAYKGPLRILRIHLAMLTDKRPIQQQTEEQKDAGAVDSPRADGPEAGGPTSKCRSLAKRFQRDWQYRLTSMISHALFLFCGRGPDVMFFFQWFMMRNLRFSNSNYVFFGC